MRTWRHGVESAPVVVGTTTEMFDNKLNEQVQRLIAVQRDLLDRIDRLEKECGLKRNWSVFKPFECPTSLKVELILDHLNLNLRKSDPAWKLEPRDTVGDNKV